jgi:hypothetical protein
MKILMSQGDRLSLRAPLLNSPTAGPLAIPNAATRSGRSLFYFDGHPGSRLAAVVRRVGDDAAGCGSDGPWHGRTLADAFGHSQEP